MICGGLPSESVLEWSDSNRVLWGVESTDFDDRVDRDDAASYSRSYSSDPASERPGEASPKPRRGAYVVVAVVIVIGMLVAAYALSDGFHRPASGASNTVLVQEGTIDTVPVGQFDAINLAVPSGNSTVNGTIIDSYGLELFTMTPAQFQYLAVKGVFNGFQWTSGVIANDTVTNVNLVFGPGSWVVVFYNPNPIPTALTTSVGFYTNLVLIS